MSETRLERVTAAGLLVALLVGCGHAQSGGTPHDGSGTPGRNTSATSDAQVAWVPPGPGGWGHSHRHCRGCSGGGGWGGWGHSTAVDQRWYKAFGDYTAFGHGNYDCDAITALGPERGQQQLYAGLSDACRAVLKKNDRLWTSAEVASQHVGDPSDRLDRSALQLLRDLVTAHQRAPHANIRIVR